MTNKSALLKIEDVKGGGLNIVIFGRWAAFFLEESRAQAELLVDRVNAALGEKVDGDDLPTDK